jgi:hypothetical protein
MRILQAVLIVLYVGISTIIFFQLKLSDSMKQHKFMKEVLGKFNFINESDILLFIRQIFSFTCGLMISFPCNFKIIMDLIVLMQANFAEWDFNCVPADLKINNGFVMEALGTVQNLFISKNVLISQNLKKGKVIQIGKQWYFDISEK